MKFYKGIMLIFFTVNIYSGEHNDAQRAAVPKQEPAAVSPKMCGNFVFTKQRDNTLSEQEKKDLRRKFAEQAAIAKQRNTV